MDIRFVDLFAGLGGFHLALQGLGHDCVFASELDEQLATLYEKNFGLAPSGDIRDVSTDSIPDHDLLCAGFPCQPFSKAGRQLGFSCPRWGDLFDHVVRILEAKRPTFVMLENVPNLEFHNDGLTWSSMVGQLINRGYSVAWRRLSPHEFGIPQVRDRVFLVASLDGLDHFEWPETGKQKTDIRSVLDTHPADEIRIDARSERALGVWQEFLERLPASAKDPSFPVWAMEFGATYPFEAQSPWAMDVEELRTFKGSFGTDLSRVADPLKGLPPYARAKDAVLPDWKIRIIQANRQFFNEHREWLTDWVASLKALPSPLQKLEWNCKGEVRNLWVHVIQFRPSGVRVKRRVTAPALVSTMTSQVPVIPWERRYMTPRECARLQSMGALPHLPDAPARAYAALGNAVNVTIVREIGRQLLGRSLSEAGVRCG